MNRTDYPKIDYFYGGDYIGTTTWSKTCREAKERFLGRLNNTADHYLGLVDLQIKKHPQHLKARFQK